MTIQSKRKVSRLGKKHRMELGYARLSLKGKSKLFCKKEHNGARMCTNDSKEYEQDLWNAYKEQNGTRMCTNDPKD